MPAWMDATGRVGGGVAHPVAAGAGTAASNDEATIAETDTAARIALEERLVRRVFTAFTPLGPIRASYPC
jgi:hypothetical protein